MIFHIIYTLLLSQTLQTAYLLDFLKLSCTLFTFKSRHNYGTIYDKKRLKTTKKGKGIKTKIAVSI